VKDILSGNRLLANAAFGEGDILSDARIEPSIAEANSTDVIQFERQGYFVRDGDSTPDRPVFNRTIGLRDTFAKEVGGKG